MSSRQITGVLLFLACFPVLSAYELEGSLDFRFVTAHIRDSVIIADSEQRDTWINLGYTELLARHRFVLGAAEAVVNHGVLAFSEPGVAYGPGIAGTGIVGAADVNPVHELYEAYVAVPAGRYLLITAGRQFFWAESWESESLLSPAVRFRRRNPAGLHFSVSDGLHPGTASRVTQPGFDGLRILFGPVGPVSIAAAIALQELLTAEETAPQPLENARYAASGWITAQEESTIGLTGVAQSETMLRGGVFALLTPGPFVLGMEGAIEAYDPRGRTVTASPLFGIRGRWTGDIKDHFLSLFGEYHYNGLANIYPDEHAAAPVTTDGAAGYLRPGKHYSVYGFALGREKRWENRNMFIANLSDNSALAEHELSLTAVEPAVLTLGVIWTSGLPTSEFGRIREDFVVTFSAGFRI